MSTERSEFDMIFLGLTIHYVYLLTICHLYNVVHVLASSDASAVVDILGYTSIRMVRRDIIRA